MTGEPDPDLGQRIVAWIVTREGESPSKDEPAGDVADMLTPQKRGAWCAPRRAAAERDGEGREEEADGMMNEARASTSSARRANRCGRRCRNRTCSRARCRARAGSSRRAGRVREHRRRRRGLGEGYLPGTFAPRQGRPARRARAARRPAGRPATVTTEARMRLGADGQGSRMTYQADATVTAARGRRPAPTPAPPAARQKFLRVLDERIVSGTGRPSRPGPGEPRSARRPPRRHRRQGHRRHALGGFALSSSVSRSAAGPRGVGSQRAHAEFEPGQATPGEARRELGSRGLLEAPRRRPHGRAQRGGAHGQRLKPAADARPRRAHILAMFGATASSRSYGFLVTTTISSSGIGTIIFNLLTRNWCPTPARVSPSSRRRRRPSPRGWRRRRAGSAAAGIALFQSACWSIAPGDRIIEFLLRRWSPARSRC